MANRDATRTICHECGMVGKTVREYHPWAVCQLFKATHDAGAVRANIKSIIQYGMLAQEAGLSVDEAFADFNLVHRVAEAKDGE